MGDPCMCGILVTEDENLIDNESLVDFIRSRGPDFQNRIDLEICLKPLFLYSSVLHLRGQSITEQPVLNDSLIFLWNGEVFGGLDVFTLNEI